MIPAVLYAVPAFLLLIAVEACVVPVRSGRRRTRLRACGTPPPASPWAPAARLVGFPWKLLTIGLYVALWSVAPVQLSPTSVWTWVLLFFADDLAYYWFHRTHHEVRLFWASHVVHHSSTYFNLSTALRQSWTPMTVAAVLAAAGAARHPAVDDLPPAVGQPALPVLPAHRADRPAAPTGRVGLQHPVAPPGPPRREPRVPGPQLRRHPDRLGPALRQLRARNAPPSGTG